jgi:microcystin-dependent protein
MPVPFPITITVKQPPDPESLPLGFTGELEDTLTAFAAALGATTEAQLLTGLAGPNSPTTPPSGPIGPAVGGVYPPWVPKNGKEWFFWDPANHVYRTSEQGAPIGSIVFWGGGGAAPVNWLICAAQALSRVTYSKLFAKIGTIWGNGNNDGLSFSLPPSYIPATTTQGALPLFYCGAPGFAAVGAQGGAASYKIIAKQHLPHLWARIHSIHFTYNATNAASDALRPDAETVPPTGQRWPLKDGAGHIFGGKQVGIPTIPPWCAINRIIKYQ